MGFQCGIVGLPNVGKSTIFNALTSAKAEAANYPFCTIEPNTGMVKVPDPRLFDITTKVKPKQTIPAAMTFVDIAGPMQVSKWSARGSMLFIDEIKVMPCRPGLNGRSFLSCLLADIPRIF